MTLRTEPASAKTRYVNVYKPRDGSDPWCGRWHPSRSVAKKWRETNSENSDWFFPVYLLVIHPKPGVVIQPGRLLDLFRRSVPDESLSLAGSGDA